MLEKSLDFIGTLGAFAEHPPEPIKFARGWMEGSKHIYWVVMIYMLELVKWPKKFPDANIYFF